jgi:predicted nuclease of predicted toxin-antitoxin system
MKAKYLIDANLPFRVPVWELENFVFVLKINPSWNDEAIWRYAKENNRIIVTEDKDFILKQAIAGAPPKLVHVKFGNMKLTDFIDRISVVWEEVNKLIQTHTIVNIYFTKIEAIK